MKYICLLVAAVAALLSSPLEASSPLCLGRFALMVKTGVAPASYTHREPIWYSLLDGTTVTLYPTPKFNQQFYLPFVVGAEVSWNASKRVQLFLEYAFTYADGKNYFLGSDSNRGIEVFNNYQANSGYLGARYYLTKWTLQCVGDLACYLGFKSGCSVQTRVVYSLANPLLSSGDPLLVSRSHFFKGQTAVSGGFHIGLEWWLGRCFSVVLQGESLFTQGMRPNQHIPLASNGNPTNINVGGTGLILSWPVNLGLRYTF